MKASITNQVGNIFYSEEVLANIAGVSTMECYGVVGMASKNAKDGLWELLKAENLSKGVKVNMKNESLSVELYIIVEYGTKISVIANNIIQKVKYNVENFTGLKVSQVIVNVQGVRV
ncbi:MULTISPECIES: Asp23/Gls24 family envelope stress response protein [Clostridium]|uniref:Asp23/Gls24 family envelope stress response protein n=1 Tax=Clostridium senegalense TaxID=1465809 RepID=A0A6M0GXG0_9CLOT|nr:MULTISPECIES: Asp23/Gls24 family envelope stress response protein [Clostridium]MBU5225586.1 Asp23/Gls24 family envelope stress response protein [Clostridium senegalense]NEU03296.1 Asp23/Gls24 family envelope stress response protein [Clostridium senegalense]